MHEQEWWERLWYWQRRAAFSDVVAPAAHELPADVDVEPPADVAAPVCFLFRILLGGSLLGFLRLGVCCSLAFLLALATPRWPPQEAILRMGSGDC